MLQAAGGDVGE